MTDRHTDRQTDASDLIICPMLCYSNGTDNNPRSPTPQVGENIAIDVTYFAKCCNPPIGYSWVGLFFHAGH